MIEATSRESPPQPTKVIIDDQNKVNTLTVAYLNIHGQSVLNISKQKQIELFIIKHDIDILNCQEINVENESLSQCPVISSKYRIIQNNALKSMELQYCSRMIMK